ncbi:aldo/keto reductase [Candidatus Latescibacterota bacterium]
MKSIKNKSVSRRKFLQASSTAAVAAPFLNCGGIKVPHLMKRTFGKLNFPVTTFGLGGQASIQWTPDDVDPVKIILKAFDSGVNYYDTSNVYGPSQMNYGKAFRELHLIPGRPGYDESLRRSIFLTSKTLLRWAKGGWENDDIRSVTNGPEGSKTLDDVRRTLSQIYGNGNGNYPQGAYIDMVLIHTLTTLPEVEALYEGLDNPDPKAENIGALAALRDVRDGTNRTGLNPKEEKLIRHIGFSGHSSAPVMMEMIRRDTDNILDGMLIAINANDRLNLNMQYNVIPVAHAKNMGIIAMKAFADGAMYTKEATWSREPKHVVRTVGSSTLPSRPLVEYSLTTPGIHTAIIGIGQISGTDAECQLVNNIASAQVNPDGLSERDRREIENMTRSIKDGKTNYFQIAEGGLTPPRKIAAEQEMLNGRRSVKLTWHTAYAGDEPLAHYEIIRDNTKIVEISHRPQTTNEPFAFEDIVDGKGAHNYKIAAVDSIGRSASSEEIAVENV